MRRWSDIRQRKERKTSYTWSGCLGLNVEPVLIAGRGLFLQYGTFENQVHFPDSLELFCVIRGKEKPQLMQVIVNTVRVNQKVEITECSLVFFLRS